MSRWKVLKSFWLIIIDISSVAKDARENLIILRNEGMRSEINHTIKLNFIMSSFQVQIYANNNQMHPWTSIFRDMYHQIFAISYLYMYIEILITTIGPSICWYLKIYKLHPWKNKVLMQKFARPWPDQVFTIVNANSPPSLNSCWHKLVFFIFDHCDAWFFLELPAHDSLIYY